MKYFTIKYFVLILLIMLSLTFFYDMGKPTLLNIISMISVIMLFIFHIGNGDDEPDYPVYVTQLNFKELTGYLTDIMIVSIEETLMNDTVVVSNMQKFEVERTIYKNALVRYLDYMKDEIPLIAQIYGPNFIGKHFNIIFHKMRKDGSLDSLISRAKRD